MQIPTILIPNSTRYRLQTLQPTTQEQDPIRKARFDRFLQVFWIADPRLFQHQEVSSENYQLRSLLQRMYLFIQILCPSWKTAERHLTS